jgi:hypothetical protein
MTPFRKRLTPATQRMAQDMLIRNMAVRTIDSYTYHVDRFSKHFGKLPEDLGPEEIRTFQLWMIQEKNPPGVPSTRLFVAYASSTPIRLRGRGWCG